MIFCSAKKRTLQHFVMNKADTANFCSQKKRTLQSLRGTLYHCVLDTAKLYNRRYKTLYTTNLGASMIQAQLRACVGTSIWKSHTSQTVTRLPSSSAFGSWNVRQKCSANMFVSYFHVQRDYPSPFFSLFIFYTIQPRAIPLSIILVPFNTLFMPYRPNANGPSIVPSVSTLFEC